MKNVVLYIGRFLFPDLNAAANRVLGIGSILAELGYEAVFAGSNETCREVDLCEDGLYRYKGFVYFARGKFSKKEFYLEWDYFFSAVESIGLPKIKYIIAYNFSALPSWMLYKWCQRNDITLIVDCTEWYKLNSNMPVWSLDSELRMRVVNPLAKNIIAISSYLENFYKNKGCTTVIIPALTSEPAMPPKMANANKDTVFCYCGDPGKKDLLPDIIRAFQRLYESRQDFKLEVVGLNKSQYIRRYNIDSDLSDVLDKFTNFHGFIPQQDAKRIVAKADFSVLLRHKERLSMAGFPTKFVDSMACGTPMIANITGDLGLYLQDGGNGFVVVDDSIDAFAIAAEKACNSTLNDRLSMIQRAIECANTRLCFKSYVDVMRTFLMDIEK